MAVEISKDKSKWGGKRDGAGRPKGSMNEASKERMETKAAFINRVNRNADKLFNAQLDLAIGEKYLMVKRTQGSGKDRKTWIEIVSDTETIKEYLDETLEDTDEEFYYMTTKPANGMALDSLLNRSFGKAEESLKLSNDPENPLTKADDLTDEELDARIESYLKRRTK